LGLRPLGKGKKRGKEILDRYQIYQEFLRTSKKFGSQRRTSEKLASTSVWKISPVLLVMPIPSAMISADDKSQSFSFWVSWIFFD
jgi:hypothetical protein